MGDYKSPKYKAPKIKFKKTKKPDFKEFTKASDGRMSDQDIQRMGGEGKAKMAPMPKKKLKKKGKTTYRKSKKAPVKKNIISIS